MLFPTLPLAYQAGCDVEIGGKDRLTGPLTSSQSANLLRRHLLDGRETQRVKLAHRLLIHPADAVQIGCRLVNGSQGVTAIFPGGLVVCHYLDFEERSVFDSLFDLNIRITEDHFRKLRKASSSRRSILAVT